jgi:hypothetical protein
MALRMEVRAGVDVPAVIVIWIVPAIGQHDSVRDLPYTLEFVQAIDESLLSTADQGDSRINPLSRQGGEGVFDFVFEAQAHPAIHSFVRILLVGHAVNGPGLLFSGIGESSSLATTGSLFTVLEYAGLSKLVIENRLRAK